MKKNVKIVLSCMLGLSLCACSTSGSSGKKDDASADEEKQTDTETEPAETPEPAASANYTDAASFAGFDSYTVNYEGTMAAETYVSGDVVFGETLLRDHYSGEISKTEQLDDLTHEKTGKVEKVEQGKAAKVTTTSISMFGKDIAFYVYNNTDAPAKPEDCVIIGIENECTKAVKFKGGILIIEQEQPSEENPADSLLKTLGEPYEMEEDNHYTWRDQSGDHIFEIKLWSSEGLYQTINFCYVNYAAGK